MIKTRILFLLAFILSVSGASAVDGEEPVALQSVFSQPVLLTSSGQAADVLIMRGLCLRAGISVVYAPQADRDSLEGIATLILVAGGSSKGLGAAKIDPVMEKKRVKGLVKAAGRAKIPLLMFHLGGAARRGALSDPFNKLASADADVLVVVASGDSDGFFKQIAENNEAQYVSVEKQIEIVELLQGMFDRMDSDDE